MDNKDNGQRHSPALNLVENEDKQVFDFFKSLLSIYNKGLFNPLINFIKADGRLLLFLIEHGGCCHPSQISDGLHLSRPNIAANLRNLEKEGYITRETDKTNRRQVFVKITPAGMDRYLDETGKIVATLSAWLKALGPDGEEQLNKILEITDKLADSIPHTDEKVEKIEKIWDID